MLLIDTSVVVAYYIPESGSPRAQQLFDQDEPLAICSLTEVEFASAMSKLVRIKALTTVDARGALDQFNRHVDERYYAFVPLDQPVYAMAQKWIALMATPLRTLDAIQLAAAHLYTDGLITADKTLVQSGKRLQVDARLL